MDQMAVKLQNGFKRKMELYGKTPKQRQRLIIKQSINLQTTTTKRLQQERASNVLTKFLMATQARCKFQAHLRAWEPFVKYWRDKALTVRRMVIIKREFLSQIFERERNTMLKYY